MSACIRSTLENRPLHVMLEIANGSDDGLERSKYIPSFQSLFLATHEVTPPEELNPVEKWLEESLTESKAGVPPDIQQMIVSNEIYHALWIEKYEQLLAQHFCSSRNYLITRFQQEKPGVFANNAELQASCSLLTKARDSYLFPLAYFDSRWRSEVEQLIFALIRRELTIDVIEPAIISFFSSNPICNLDLDEKAYKNWNTFVEAGLKREVTQIAKRLVPMSIQHYVKRSFKKSWKVSVLNDLTIWINKIYNENITNMALNLSINQLMTYGIDALRDLRVSELYDIVMAYPTADGALYDLKHCLQVPEQRVIYTQEFQRACGERLLRPSSDTTNIVLNYICTIKSFLILDPRGILLDRVSRPIRKYLKERLDLIPVLVSGMLGEESSELAFLADQLPDINSYEGEFDDLRDYKWIPEPLDAPPDFIKGKFGDVINSFISLFDNKEVFVKEFADYFANKMLQLPGYDVQNIQDHVQILKTRFGQKEMHNIDIMVRDIVESGRIDNAIHDFSGDGQKDDTSNKRRRAIDAETGESSSSKPFIHKEVHAKVLSRLYWPPFKESELNPPSAIRRFLRRYASEFAHLKPQQELRWLPGLGNVTVDLKLENRKMKLVVTPEQATTIALYDGINQISLAKVMELSALDEARALSCLNFWISRGVLAYDEDTQLYYVVENDTEQEKPALQEVSAFEQGAAISRDERSQEEMKIYWSYIVGMLTNLGAKPASQIHSFLKMLVPAETPFSKTVDELTDFLQTMVDEEKLIMEGDAYKLVR